jgi:GGDEF domain-containing protein
LISLSRYLNSGTGVASPSAIRAISLLIQGMGLHSLDQNKEDYDYLRSELTYLEQGLGEKTNEPELLIAVGQVLKTLETYNRRTAGRLRAQFAELQGIISTLSGAVGKMVSASDVSLGKLKGIQSEITGADQIEDLKRLKTHLSACLETIGQEVESHRYNSSSSLTALTAGLQEFESRVARVQTQVATDPVTGLPMRGEAETVLAKNAELSTKSVAVIFAIKRLKQVNIRFGYASGDGMLERLATYLGSAATPADGLYRWNGPALLAIFSRDFPFDRIRDDVRKLVTAIPEYEVRIGTRVAEVVMAVGWAIFPVTRPADKIVRQIDAFVASQLSEDG